MSALLVLYLTILLVLFTVAVLVLHHEVKRIDELLTRLENTKDRDDSDEFDLFS